MVSAPAFDPLDPPEDVESDPAWEGVYLNRLLSGTFPPGSVYKTVTLAAAIENIPDLFDRTWTCTGSTQVGDGAVTCPRAHGELDIYSALSSSCNGVFALLAWPALKAVSMAEDKVRDTFISARTRGRHAAEKARRKFRPNRGE